MENKPLRYMVPLICDQRAGINVIGWPMTIKCQSQGFKKPISRAWAGWQGGGEGGGEQQNDRGQLTAHHVSSSLLPSSHFTLASPKWLLFHRDPSFISFVYAVPTPRTLSPSCHCGHSLLMPSDSVPPSPFPVNFSCSTQVSCPHLYFPNFLCLLFPLYLQCASQYDYEGLYALVSSARFWAPECQGTFFSPSF